VNTQFTRSILPAMLLTHVLLSAGSSNAAASDPRIKTVVYDPNVIVEITAGKFPVLIELPFGESPVAVVSDGNGNEETKKTWDISYKKGESFVFVQPLSSAKAAQLIIRSNKNSYLFDLIPESKAGIQAKDRVAKVVMVMPPPQFKAEELEVLSQAVAKVREEKAKASTAMEAKATDAVENACPSPMRRNEKYTLEVVKEGSDIRPREVFDDGRMTYMRFPNNLSIPVVYKSTPGAEDERLVNTHMVCDYLVLHGVAKLWNLRLGSAMLGVFNEDFDVEGIPPPRESTLEGKARVLK
jgi:type IV secretion system protein VirB9